METNNNENNIQENETLDMNHLMQVRREKLDKLREEKHLKLQSLKELIQVKK